MIEAGCKGERADILQSGIVYAMALAVIGHFITLFINRAAA